VLEPAAVSEDAVCAFSHKKTCAESSPFSLSAFLLRFLPGGTRRDEEGGGVTCVRDRRETARAATMIISL